MFDMMLVVVGVVEFVCVFVIIDYFVYGIVVDCMYGNLEIQMIGFCNNCVELFGGKQWIVVFFWLVVIIVDYDGCFGFDDVIGEYFDEVVMQVIGIVVFMLDCSFF